MTRHLKQAFIYLLPVLPLSILNSRQALAGPAGSGLDSGGIGLLNIFLLCLILFGGSGAILYFRWLIRKFREENKALSEKLSERSHLVMIQKWELERQNRSVMEQNKEILEGLHYARTIQSAILPPASLISSAFKDAFVLYKPKDIVGGDFYFFSKTGPYHIVAVGDCTGHGVAGAFMTMVGSALLHQLITQKGITDPGTLLKELNLGILESMRQSEQQSHGGMDLVICVFSEDLRKMRYAGAKRPVWLLRDKQIEEFKGERFSIGGFQPFGEMEYRTHQVELRSGDRLYLFTDGYQDQFGELTGKKIMTKNLKQVLEESAAEPVSSQQSMLENYFNAWKGRFEQVDDVLILGVEV